MPNRSFASSMLVLIVLAMTGCAPTPKSVSMAELQDSLNKIITKKSSEIGRHVTTSDISSRISLDDLPLVGEVCSANYALDPNYDFDGSMMRFKLEHYAYLFPVDENPDSRLYVHNYAVCSTFYPSKNESDIQEVVYVRYIGLQKSNYVAFMNKKLSFDGEFQGLLRDAGFNKNLSSQPLPTGFVWKEGIPWANVTRKTFDAENQLFLKMEVLNMEIINKYDGEKFDDLLAVEYVYANVSNVNGALTIQGTPVAIIQEVTILYPTFPPS